MVRDAKKGNRVVRLGDGVPPSPRTTPWKGSDLTVYKFLRSDGKVIVATRSELRRAHPEVTPGALSDLVNGKVRRTKGFQVLGRVDPTPPTD